MIVADTNIVSEFMRDAPNETVLAWGNGLRNTDLALQVITVTEIERGLGAIPAGRRREDLHMRWNRMLHAYRHSVLEYDLKAAQATAEVLLESRKLRRGMSFPDAQIAGICIANNAELATRNVKDFSHLKSLSLINPFSL